MMVWDTRKERRLQKSILDIKKKYGKNAVLRGLGYEEETELYCIRGALNVLG